MPRRSLDTIARYHTSSRKGGFTHGWKHMYELYKEYRFRAIEKYLKAGGVLELGPAEGDMTERLLRRTKNVSVLEGSGEFVRKLTKRFDGRIKIHKSLLDDFKPQEAFDNIIMSHVLEHLDKPVTCLKRIGSWLKSRGRLIIIVPNSDSLHRRVGVGLGMLKKVSQLNDVDINIGHKRIYNPLSLTKTIEAAGLRQLNFSGILLKPLSNTQMVRICSERTLRVFFELGEQFKDIACEIVAVCVKG